ncbi:hypothetical protein BaRGS_00024725 [Batillaria attramentaria]|uniref:Uncharacterized protein n=1 Tax=Batillaria attramentaria TaxID=370345 RepID=A0ABD0KA80_9CAEN
MSSASATVVGTWAFSVEPVKLAGRLVNSGERCVDIVEKSLNVAEEDERYGPYFVGRGGKRNARGELEQDAAVMRGDDLAFGAVTALQGVSRPVSVARLVMEKSRHSMLTGQGAQDFALQHGFHLDQNITRVLSQSCGESVTPENETAHDTLGIIVLDKEGSVSAGVTTSGMAGKARGRVGDSALPGCGLYTDSEVGAACCSGDGDQIMKFCPSFHIVELMRQGMNPECACHTAVKRIIQRLGAAPVFELAVIALNTKGEVGAATTVEGWTDVKGGPKYPGFPYAVWTQGMEADPEIRVAKKIT